MAMMLIYEKHLNTLSGILGTEEGTTEDIPGATGGADEETSSDGIIIITR